MNSWRLLSYTKLSDTSIDSDNSGQLPVRAKVLKVFRNEETHQVTQVTDLQSKLIRRDRILSLFAKTYVKKHFQGQLTILCAVANESSYPLTGKFINTLQRKLNRKGVKLLGYVWCRDVGQIAFEKHFHVLLAATRIDAGIMKSLFSRKGHSNYNVRILKRKDGMFNYLKRKELYGKRNQRSFGKSRVFKLPVI